MNCLFCLFKHLCVTCKLAVMSVRLQTCSVSTLMCISPNFGFLLVRDSLASLLSSSLDDGTFLEHSQPSSSGGEGEGGVAEITPPSSAPVTALAPSLTPASQPTISLLTDNSTDTLSVDSLTLLPPADSPHLHPCTSYSPATHSLQKPDASIPEEEEDDEKDGISKEEEEASQLGKTERDATVKEELTTELVTPTEEEPEGQDNSLTEMNQDKELQKRDDLRATESAEKTEVAEIQRQLSSSPELD